MLSIRPARPNTTVVALLRIVDMLFAVIGLDETAVIATLPRCTRNYVLRILRPAESAARRLIVVAARGIKVAVRVASECGETIILTPSSSGLTRGPIP
jgi:hypothetical protein